MYLHVANWLKCPLYRAPNQNSTQCPFTVTVNTRTYRNIKTQQCRPTAALCYLIFLFVHESGIFRLEILAKTFQEVFSIVGLP